LAASSFCTCGILICHLPEASLTLTSAGCGRLAVAGFAFHIVRAFGALQKGNVMAAIMRLLFVLGLAAAPVLCASSSWAQEAQTWVASTGTDTGNTTCPRSNPCATFQHAFSETATGGEIDCVDSGNYGGLSISSSVTINCEYAIDAITGGSSLYITSTGSPVILRGMDLDGGGLGASFPLVGFYGSGLLRLEKVKFGHFTDTGGAILFQPSGTATLDIVDSYITDNGSSGTAAGIYIQPQSGVQANVTITRTQVQGNYFGIVADGTKGGTIRGVVKDSVVSGSAQNGITASSSGSSVVLMIDGTAVSSNNNHGLAAAGSGAGMLVRNSSVFNNAGGLFAESGATLYSYGNNSVNGNNGNDGTFSGTVGQQ
jgi:hypothetical protein